MKDKATVIEDFRLIKKILKPDKIYNLYHFKPIKGFSIDSRSLKKGEAYLAIRGKYKDGHDFIEKAVSLGSPFIIAERYIPLKSKVPFFVVSSTYDSLRKIAAYTRLRKKPIVCGITGSIGKTTIKDLLKFLLDPYFKVLKNEKTENNILGVCKTIFSLKDESVVVLELGTNTKGEMKELVDVCTPDVGVISFIKPVHLQGLGSLEGILEEKMSLVGSNPRMKIILNRDDTYLSRIKGNSRTHWFGMNQRCDLFANLIKREGGDSVFRVQNKYELILPSYLEAFIYNYLAALLSAHLLGLPLDVLVKRAQAFKDFPSMRMCFTEFKGYNILNDAYNSNPYSFTEALRVLRSYPLKKIFIVGDMLELGGRSEHYHKLMAPKIKNGKVDYCLAIGDCTTHMIKRLRKIGYKNAYHFSSHKSIAQFIEKRIVKGKKSKKRYLIFLKGSRNMELEKVLNHLK